MALELMSMPGSGLGLFSNPRQTRSFRVSAAGFPKGSAPMPEELELDDDDQTTEDGQDSRLLRELRRQLKEANRRAKEAEALAEEGRQALRERAFDKAGIPDTKLGALFRESYKGDLTPEAIRGLAVEYELIKEDTSMNEEVSGIERMTSVARGQVADSQDAAFNDEVDRAAAISTKAVADVFRKYGREVR